MDAGIEIPALPVEKIPESHRRQVVAYETDQAPGTIIINTKERALYQVMPDGKAMRYLVAVGKEGFSWAGTARIGMKREKP